MSATTEYFPGVSKVQYKGPGSTEPLSFRYYNAEEVIMGKPMKEWLRFSVCYWHTFRGNGADPFGLASLVRPWEDDALNPLEMAKRRADVAFEFFTKLGVEYYSFHDRDVAPEGSTLQESNAMLDTMADYLLEKQEQTGVKLLWATQNLFSHPRYMNGAATNPELDVFCYAAAQTKKLMDVNHKLGGLNHVFWGGREGYQSLLNTDIRKDLDHLAALYRMANAYKESKGMTAQFLIEPKPREPSKHQYDYDAQTAMAFLAQYDLTKHFKLNIEPNHTTLAGHEEEHDILIASKYDMLGSVDSNTGDTLLGWDTDQFPTDIQKTTAIMKIVLEQGGLAPGGLNFDCKVRRESVDPVDMFIGHIGGMDNYARGLRNAARMMEEGVLDNMVKERYCSFDSELGKKIEAGQVTLEECEAHALANGEPKLKSGKQELYEMIRNRYV